MKKSGIYYFRKSIRYEVQNLLRENQRDFSSGILTYSKYMAITRSHLSLLSRIKHIVHCTYTCDESLKSAINKVLDQSGYLYIACNMDDFDHIDDIVCESPKLMPYVTYSIR